MVDTFENLIAFLTGLHLYIEDKTDDWTEDDCKLMLCIENRFYLGFYTPDQTWFLQRIISNPGDYYEPPSEDYVEIACDKALVAVIGALGAAWYKDSYTQHGENLADLALEKEREKYEKDR